jgi:hypothetical protein
MVQAEMPHTAWHLLFFNPIFWEHTGRQGLALRRVCRHFRAEIPQQFAIEAAFSGVHIHMAAAFRLFPLAVRDVLRLRSPLLFADAFRMALIKTGSFEFCIAIMREERRLHVRRLIFTPPN